MCPPNETVTWRGHVITIVSPPEAKPATTGTAALDRQIVRVEGGIHHLHLTKPSRLFYLQSWPGESQQHFSVCDVVQGS